MIILTLSLSFLLLLGCQSDSVLRTYADKAALITVGGEALNRDHYLRRHALLSDIWRDLGYNLAAEDMSNVNDLIHTTLVRELIFESRVRAHATAENILLSQSEYARHISRFDNASEERLVQIFRPKWEVETLVQNIYAKMRAAISISDSAVRGFYDSNPGHFVQEETVQARHILLKDKAEADRIHLLLREGASFEELAKTYSLDGSGEQGGDLGSFARGTMVPEFDRVAFSTQVGAISQVFTTQFGYHILRVDDKRVGGVVPFEQVSERIRDYLEEKEFLRQTRSLFEGLSERLPVVGFEE